MHDIMCIVPKNTAGLKRFITVSLDRNSCPKRQLLFNIFYLKACSLMNFCVWIFSTVHLRICTCMYLYIPNCKLQVYYLTCTSLKLKCFEHKKKLFLGHTPQINHLNHFLLAVSFLVYLFGLSNYRNIFVFSVCCMGRGLN